MDETESLAHAKWECKYHVVWIPKYRRQALYAELRKYLGPVLRELARQREVVVEEGHLQLDHVHMLLSIPPKYAVAQVLGYIKGKSAIHIARTYLGRRQNFTGQHFWARGYYVSTVAKRGRHSGVHPEAASGGPAPRPTRDLRWVAPPSGGGRFANRFERFTSFHTTGFAGGT
jgi:putative transposase